jgi:hypothetical protein
MSMSRFPLTSEQIVLDSTRLAELKAEQAQEAEAIEQLEAELAARREHAALLAMRCEAASEVSEIHAGVPLRIKRQGKDTWVSSPGGWNGHLGRGASVTMGERGARLNLTWLSSETMGGENQVIGFDFDRAQALELARDWVAHGLWPVEVEAGQRARFSAPPGPRTRGIDIYMRGTGLFVRKSVKTRALAR